MQYPRTIQYIQADLQRNSERKHQRKIATLIWDFGFQAVMVYRISHSIKLFLKRHRNPVLLPLYVLDSIVRRVSEVMTTVQINPKAEIGPGLYLPHASGIIIGPVVIGRNCDIYQGVTIGEGIPWGEGNIPRIGDRVYIGPGAKIMGHIEIGDDAAIGPNAVVVKSVPERGILQAVAGRLVSKAGSFDLVTYSGMENDPDRHESMLLSEKMGMEVGSAVAEKMLS